MPDLIGTDDTVRGTINTCLAQWEVLGLGADIT